jgi:hypothetical protein
MVPFARLPRRLAERLEAEIEAAGIPVMRFRAGVAVDAGREPDDELLVPATVEHMVVERYGHRRAALSAEARKGDGREGRSVEGRSAEGRSAGAASPSSDAGRS